MKEITYLEAIREALDEEMARDPSVFILGEDVGVYGGAFRVTEGFYEKYGEWRVLDTPLSESGFTGGHWRSPCRYETCGGNAVCRFYILCL